MAGALSNLYVGDRLGRRKTITLYVAGLPFIVLFLREGILCGRGLTPGPSIARGGVIMIIGAILQTASVDYAMMLVARVITGVGNGLLTSTVPAYQSECAPPHRRGQLVLFEGSLITLGVMLSYCTSARMILLRHIAFSSRDWMVD